MTNKITSMLSRLAAPFLKPTLAILAACIVGGVWGDWLYWDNGGNNNIFTTPENWSTDVFPGTSHTTAFEGDAVGKTIVFNEQGTKVKEVFVRNNWWSKDELAPVVFTATDPAYGFDSQGVFSCGDFGGTVNGCRSALTIQSGTYTAAALSYWGWCANAGFALAIEGGSSLTLNAGLNMMYGGYSDDNTPWSNIGNVTNSINIKSGTLTVNGGDVLIGDNSDNSKTTINVGDANGNGSAEAVFSVGSATSHNLKLTQWSCAGTTIEINVNNGGTLKAYNIVNGGGTGNPALNINFNGGTLQALGVGDTALIGSDLAVTVSAAGGTIDTNGKEVTIASAITGGGTLYVKGGGKVTFTATPTCTVLVEGDTTAVDGSENAIGTVQNTWIGESGDYWNDSTKWSAGSVPTSSQLVKIDTDGTIKISGWSQTDADVCKAGAVIIDANVTFNGPWKRLWVYGIAGRDAISGSGTLTLSDNTGLENGSASSVLEISSGLTFDGNADHAWLGGDVTGSIYGWRVKGATTINCTIQTDKPAEFAGALTIGANGVINTMGNAVTVTATSVSGAGLTFTGSGVVTIPLSGAMLTVPAITSAGDLSVSGWGDISVVGAVSVSGELAFTPNSYVQKDENMGYTISLTAASVAAGEISGVGIISTTSGVTVSGASTFHGKVSGTGGLVVTDSMTIYGLNDFSGNLAIGPGSAFTIVSSLAGLSPYWRLDATDADSITTTDGKVTKWSSQVGEGYFSNESSEMLVVENYFGTSLNAVKTSGSILTSSWSNEGNGDSYHGSSIFGVVNVERHSPQKIMYGCNGINNWYIGRRSTASQYDKWTKMLGSGNQFHDGIWQNGVYKDVTYHNDARTVSILGFYRQSNMTSAYIGGDSGSDVGIGELMAFSFNPSHMQRVQIETYLSNKWGVGNSLPNVSVLLGASAVLDLGATKQTISAISINGAGLATVQNGKLTITEPISLSDGQILRIPADATYSLAEGVRAVTTGGTTTLSTSAAHVGSTPFQTVQDAIDAVVAGTATGTLTIHESATVNLSTTAASITDVVLDDGVALTFAANLPWQGSYSNGTIVNQRVASTFVWTPQNNSTDWATLGNWKIGGASATDLPGVNDTVVLPENGTEVFESWHLTVSSDISVAEIVLNAAAEVSSGNFVITTPSVSGPGKLIVKGLRVQSPSDKELNLRAPVEIPYGYTLETGAGSQYHYVNLYSKVTGTGTWSMNQSNTQERGAVQFHGDEGADMSEFAGNVTVYNTSSAARDNTKFWATCSSSSNAVWTLRGYDKSGHNHACMLRDNNTTYYFGALNGSVFASGNQTSFNNNTWEIGARNDQDSVLTGNFFHNSYPSLVSSRSDTIRKVGVTSTLIFSGSRVKAYEIQAGALVLTADSSFKTEWDGGSYDSPISFTGTSMLGLGDSVTVDPSAQIVVNSGVSFAISNATARTFANAIGSGTTGGFTKKGAGTLTLSQPPAYTGTTTVEAGALVMPASAEASLTLGANTIVSARDANTITLANATTVNVTGLAHDHATATVTAGGESVTVNEGVAAVPVGSNVVITWTPASGYQITAGGTQEISNIREAVAAAAPTVSELPTVSIAAPVVGAYGNDFATVSVTAGVTSTYPAATEITYTLKANGTAIASTKAAGNATSVTFDNANVSGLSRYGNISYTVEASGESVTSATSGATTAMLADSEGWIDEKKSTTGTTGSWKTADGAAATVTYDNETERAELSDNKFSANNCSTGDVVTVTIKDVIYTALSDTSAVDADAQGSIALGGTESAPKFMVLTKSGNEVQWSEAAGVDPALNTSYTIVFTFDYNSNKYSITVNGAALTVGGSATYDIVKTTNKYVKDIDFLGAGSIKAIEGIQYDAMMAVDQDGVRYATVADALNANKGVRGAIIKLLHGTANTNIAGWNYNADTKTFIKKAVGLIFLAF